MLIGYSSAPFAIRPLQWLWLPNAGKRMFLDVREQIGDAFHDTRVTGAFPIVTVFPCLLQKNYFHKSSNAMG